MFKKVISNLAFTPSSMSQVAFYYRHLKQEESVRRLGFGLIVLTMFVQLFAAIAPPEQSLAQSGNDVIPGGVSSIGDLKNKYNSRADVKALYNRFGINASHMNTTGSVSNVTFNFQEQGSRGTKTIGRINFASTKDTPLGPYAGTTFYGRNAAEWPGSTPAYFFDKHKGTDGRYYYIWVLKDCGNIAYRAADAPAPAPKPAPKPKPQKPAAPKPTPKPAITPAPIIAPTITTPAPPAPVVDTSPTPTPVTPQTPQPKPEPVCPYNPALKPDDELCKCVDDQDISATDEKCTTLILSKSVQNITQNLSPEQTVNNLVKANDILEYTLSTRNVNVAPKTNVNVEDYIGDLLDYGTIDLKYLAIQGGTYNEAEKKITWSSQTIPAKSEHKKSFRIVVKDVIPSTNQPNATAPEFDCKIQNGYGNEITLNMECPVLKSVETLPNTGPGTTVAIAFTVSVLSGYFFMRSRLLSKEIGIIRKSYQSGY